MPKDKGIQLNDNNTNGQILDLKIEVLKDSGGKIIQGLIVGNTLQQNQALILITHQGENKFNPDLGVGISDILLDNDYLNYRHRIRENYAKDGLKVTHLDLYENKPLKIDANY
ncbi:MAG TPA: hypothetical protein VLY87_07780 [Flavobacterium sp.]|nr:hypothetical protein [Flavobacterium sp.]